MTLRARYHDSTTFSPQTSGMWPVDHSKDYLIKDHRLITISPETRGFLSPSSLDKPKDELMKTYANKKIKGSNIR